MPSWHLGASLCVEGEVAFMQALDSETWAAISTDVREGVHRLIRAEDYDTAVSTINELIMYCRSRRFHPVMHEDLLASADTVTSWLRGEIARLGEDAHRTGLQITLERGIGDHYRWTSACHRLHDNTFAADGTTAKVLNDMCASLTRWPHEAGPAAQRKVELAGFDHFKRATNGLNPINQPDDLVALDIARLKVAIEFHRLVSKAAKACGNGPAWLVVQDHAGDWLPLAVREVIHDPEAQQASGSFFGKLFRRAS